MGASNDLDGKHGGALEHAMHGIPMFERAGQLDLTGFNGKFRDYCLDLHLFASLSDARATIDSWRTHYNQVGPHRSLGRKPPAVFAEEAA